MAKLAVWLSGMVEFEQVAEILARVGQVPMSTSSVWRRVKTWGERFQAQEQTAEAQAAALPTGDLLLPGERRSGGPMGVALDGAMVHIRQEGWKELKTGCVFAVVPRRTWEAKLDDWVDVPQAVQNSYVTHLGGPERFGWVLWAEARRRQWTRAGDTLVVADGAEWIWNLVREHFYDSRQAVDWYHAAQHLWTVAHALHGEGTSEARQWYRAHETPLFEGSADQLAASFRASARTHPNHADCLRREANYFEGHLRRMQYQELREDGWPIGSGMVESACKQYRHRFVGAGMRWSRPGIERLLPVRSALLSRRFDEVWSNVYKPPLN